MKSEHSVLGDEDDAPADEHDEAALVPQSGLVVEHSVLGDVKLDEGGIGLKMDPLEAEEWQEAPCGRDRSDSLSGDSAVDIYTWRQCGYLSQYFVVGLIYGGLPATIYGFFLGYLAVPGYIYSTATVLCVFPWSFKFVFGLINDTAPICGYHRKPYMVLGWSMCAGMLVVLSLHTIPPPYWCRDDDGNYIETNPDGSPATPCNPEAATKGGEYAFLMMLAALGYVIADVAADGLTVQYARREPEAQRGSIQTTVYLTRTIGSIFAQLLVAFGMNSKEYLGEFDSGLTFNQYCGILALPCLVMVPLSWYGIQEKTTHQRPALREYLKQAWGLLMSKAMFYVVVYKFCERVVSNITTPAGGLVKSKWAGVKTMQNQMFSLAGSAIFAGGLAFVKKYCLNRSWRWMLLITTIGLNLLDMPFSYLTIYDVVRNQYFYMGETLLYEIPDAAHFVVGRPRRAELSRGAGRDVLYCRNG